MIAPKISIIIPVYNVEKYLRRCLDSVVNQTFQNWQAVCVDDGSPDNSGAILDEYAARDKRFVVVHQKNGGLSNARNAGLEKSSGQYVLYLDSDDFLHPQTLEILNHFVKRDNAEMVVFNIDAHATREMNGALDAGANVSQFIPTTYHKKYNISKIANRVTDKILFYSTERNHTFGRFRVRHCYPVLKMLKHDLALKNRFIENIIIEDFPWWSSVMLARPHTTIIRAPLYFYTPNTTSILHSSKATRMIMSIFAGIKSVYKLYKSGASVAEMAYYNRNFLWPFIIIACRKFGDLDDDQDKAKVRSELSKLYAQGVFDNPPTRRARKYKRRIENFISQI